MPLFCAESRAQNASSAMAFISLRITESSDGVANRTTRSTLQG